MEVVYHAKVRIEDRLKTTVPKFRQALRNAMHNKQVVVVESHEDGKKVIIFFDPDSPSKLRKCVLAVDDNGKIKIVTVLNPNKMDHAIAYRKQICRKAY